MGKVIPYILHIYILLFYYACKTGKTGLWVATGLAFVISVLIHIAIAANGPRTFWSAPSQHGMIMKDPLKYFFFLFITGFFFALIGYVVFIVLDLIFA